MKKSTLLVLACASLLNYSMITSACNKCHCHPVGVQANSVSFTLGWGKDFFATKRHVENAGVPFVAADYQFTKQWGIEGLVGFFNTSFTGSNDNGEQTNGNLILVDATYHFEPYRFIQPYALAGIGVTSFSSNRTDANNQGNINAGVGVQLFVNEVVSFKFDARDIYTIVGGRNDIFIAGGVNLALQLC